MKHRYKLFGMGFKKILFVASFSIMAFWSNAMVDSCDVLACNDNVFISVIEGNTYPPSADMFLEGFYCQNRQYNLYMLDGNGNEQDFDLIHDGLPSTFVYIVEDDVNKNRCWGEVQMKVIACNQLRCNDLINFTVQKNDTYTVTPQMLIKGSYCFHHDFLIEYDDGSGYQNLNQITDQLPASFNYRITDLDNGNVCTGTINLRVIDCDDPFTGSLTSKDIELGCFEDLHTHVIGFPIPDTYTAQEDDANTNTYIIEDWSPCGPLTLVYADNIINYNCNDPYRTVVKRNWVLYDDFGIVDQTTDTYSLKPASLDDLEAPQNFDGVEGPVLDCNDEWFVGNNDNIPDPEYTGKPYTSELCASYAMMFEDQVFIETNTPCYSYKKILRTWTVLDWCLASTREFIQVIKVECSDDEEAPVAVCDSEVTVTLDGNGEFTLYPETIDEASYDDCGIARLSFDAAGTVDKIVFDGEDANTSVDVTLYVTDYTGKQNECFTTVEILPFIADTGNLGGKFFNYNLEPYQFEETIQYEVSNGRTKKVVSSCTFPKEHQDLSFALCVDDDGFEGPYTLAFKTPETNPISGISTTDYVVLQKYLLGKHDFNEYVRYAADLNNSASVSASDAAWIRSLVLGRRSLERDPWSFVPLNDSYQFSDLPNYNIEFVPIRIGDLDNKELTGGWTGNQTRTGEDVLMYYYDQDVTKGQVFDVWFHVEGEVDIVGLQIGQSFENGSLSVINATAPNYSHGEDWAGYDSEWRYFMVNPTVDEFTLKGEWLNVTFRAEQDGPISEFFSANDYPFDLLVVHEDLSESKIILEVREATSSTDFVNSTDIKVYPNPFKGQTTIDFSGMADLDGRFKLYSTGGQLLYDTHMKDLSPSGQLIIDQNILKQSGLYFGVAETSTGRHIIKINKL